MIKKKVKLPDSGAELTTLLLDCYGIESGASLILAQSAGQALDQALAAEVIIEQYGLVVEGERGLRANPACTISRDSRSRLLACLRALNLEL
jgi:hypothetical protein